jgi:hypothetical protein
MAQIDADQRGLTSVWLLYAMAAATEAPSWTLAILQYPSRCARIGPVGSLAMLASEK